MIIKSENGVPYFYRNSRDYKAILNIFDLILNAIKTDIDNIVENFDPYKCNKRLLELLASYVGYDYDIGESYDANRLIIDNYITMIRNRGNILGIKMAAALSFNAEEDLEKVEELDMFSVDYIKSDNKIAIYVYYPVYLDNIRNLLERVRPAGVGLEIVPAYDIRANEAIEVHDYIEPPKPVEYDNMRRNVSDKSRVGYGEVTRKGEPHKEAEGEQTHEQIVLDKDRT